MTPDEARALLDGTTPGPWGYYSPRGKDGHYDPVFGDVPGDEIALVKRPADWHLITAAPALAAMIAGMREEWGVHVTGYPKNIADWAELCDSPADSVDWFADEEAAEAFATEREDEGFNIRLVRRYVTEPEEA